ncbi:hypothetical protein SCP_0113080 [Sparassis crispa]|uniref:C2H2-type domain-containing protein n=1 Tax=Sparassis crispa TaxID=139825 RepID=A0A401G8A2_9APHY|nr:hypothetical protein SCP_0113080 [Sparassis crispa]GBE78420.1 hypothetical protein SCP_0113080 [Sparassis crispa]
MGQQLRRSGLSCRNRWRMLERKKASRREPSESTLSVANVDMDQPPLDDTSTQWMAIPVDSRLWDHDASHFMSSLSTLPIDAMLPLGETPPSYLPSEDFAALDTSYDQTDVCSDPVDRPPFQYASSSLSRALSSPLTSPSPQAHYALYPSPISEHLNLTEASSSAGPTVHEPDHAAFVALDNLSGVDYNDSRYYQNGRPSDSEMNHTHGCGELPVAIGASPEIQSVILTPASSVLTLLSLPASLPSSSGDFETPMSAAGSEPPSSPAVHDTALCSAAPSANWQCTSRGWSLRLSANLPATSDSGVLAYACGHQLCWPEGTITSSACFATSGDLLEHNRAKHPQDHFGSKPFKCGLAGCGKSWKNINGLQYHLQISKTHFQQALAASVPIPAESTNSTTDPSQAESSRVKAKTFPCTYPGCRNEYKQLSGLRYHLAHGHPPDMPAQLDVVPPALARKMAEKLQNKALPVVRNP